MKGIDNMYKVYFVAYHSYWEDDVINTIVAKSIEELQDICAEYGCFESADYGNIRYLENAALPKGQLIASDELFDIVTVNGALLNYPNTD